MAAKVWQPYIDDKTPGHFQEIVPHINPCKFTTGCFYAYYTKGDRHRHREEDGLSSSNKILQGMESLSTFVPHLWARIFHCNELDAFAKLVYSFDFCTALTNEIKYVKCEL